MTAGMAGQLSGQMSLYDLLGPPEEPAVAASPPLQITRVEPKPQPAQIEPVVPTPPPLQVEVTRSRRRKKTAEAQLLGSTLKIRIPASCNADEERYFVNHFQDKFERSRASAMVDLEQRAKKLAAAYRLPEPASIRWVSNQKSQWGSCTPSDGSIRLSDRMAGFPAWVVDYVVVHELAHLVEGDHSPAFWALVNRYPKTERARGYLMAKDEG
ncbi:MAG: M48 family metallopeptidase [Actinomycetota bacterium]